VCTFFSTACAAKMNHFSKLSFRFQLAPLRPGELGNLKREHLSRHYKGVALTLIDSMSTLAVLGWGLPRCQLLLATS